MGQYCWVLKVDVRVDYFMCILLIQKDRTYVQLHGRLQGKYH
jgi:hypothetical protein